MRSGYQHVSDRAIGVIAEAIQRRWQEFATTPHSPLAIAAYLPFVYWFYPLSIVGVVDSQQ